MRIRKSIALFIEAHKKCYPYERICEITSFLNTRWTSHCRVLSVIFSKYKALNLTLKELSISIDREIASIAQHLLAFVRNMCFFF